MLIKRNHILTIMPILINPFSIKIINDHKYTKLIRISPHNDLVSETFQPELTWHFC